jgi:hypothetical protein
MEAPEAEWGFDEQIMDGLMDFAAQRDLRVQRITFQEPEDMSPVVSELYRSVRQGAEAAGNQLLVDSFVVMDPLLTRRMGAVPYWALFNTHSSLERLESYLSGVRPYDEIYVLLFPNGVPYVGQARPQEWEDLIRRAAGKGAVLATDKEEYPYDIGSLLSYHSELRRRSRHWQPHPRGDNLDEVCRLLADLCPRYSVSLTQER